MIQSWLTTLLGFAGAALLLIGPHLSDPKKPWIDAEEIPAALAIMGLGAAAKDARVHSTIAQSEEASADARAKALGAASGR